MITPVKPIRRTGLVIAGVVAAVLLVSASSCQGPSEGQRQENAQQQAVTQQLVKNQPLPAFGYSQMRQNLIEIETAQATGVQTTTFFFNQGVADPLFTCPSIGVPIPNTSSLSNPIAVELHQGTESGGNVAIGQMDPNGTYIPESSTGTYVVCLDAQARPFATYWEGFIKTVFAPAKWNTTTRQVELTGPASFKFTAKQQGR